MASMRSSEIAIPGGRLRARMESSRASAELRQRLFASWVAENRLAEHRARGDWLPLGIGRGTQSQGGIDFAWREEVIATPHPAFRRVDVFVSALPEPRELAHLTGFVVLPAK